MTLRPIDNLIAIDVSTRGYGFAALNGQADLLAAATTDIRDGDAKEAARRVALLILRFRPKVIVLEDVAANNVHRPARARAMIQALATEAERRKIAVHKVSMAQVGRTIVGSAKATKTELAEKIAERFAYLADRIPRRKSSGHPEPRSTRIFDAIGLGLTFLRKTGQCSIGPGVGVA